MTQPALIIVDIQNDFCPGGALAVDRGNQIVPVINRLQGEFDLVVATKDWHPAGHVSFASTHGKAIGGTIEVDGLPQMLWPDHCVQGTPGAEFHPALRTERIAHVVLKGTNPVIDSYSGFFDNARRQATELEPYLRGRGVDAVVVVGLAANYCVKFTALDAASLGFRTFVVKDATRGIDAPTGSVDACFKELQQAGVAVITSGDALQHRGVFALKESNHAA